MDPVHGIVDQARGSVHGPRRRLGGVAHRSVAERCFSAGIRGARLGKMEESPRGLTWSGPLAVRRCGRRRSATVAERQGLAALRAQGG
jgi:hypothetical protein